MAVTYGFFNSLNGDRTYDAVQFSSIFDGLITDGVFATYGQGLVVTASDPASLNVIVGSGRAWFNHTWTYNDAPMSIACNQSDVVLPRYDAIVLEVNSEQTVRKNNIKFVQGTAASAPAKPAMTRTEYINQYPLCYIYRPANSSVIATSNIENMIGKTECPIVTGIVKTIDPNDLLRGWEAALADEISRIQAGTEVALKVDTDYYKAVFPVANWTDMNGSWFQEVDCIGLTAGVRLDAPKTKISQTNSDITKNLQKGLQAMCSTNGFIYRCANNDKLQWYTRKKPEIDMEIYVRKATFRNADDTPDASLQGVYGSGGGGFVVQSTAPTDSSLLWIDTSSNNNFLKFYNGSAWVPIGSVWG